jgi:hypothetical protein
MTVFPPSDLELLGELRAFPSPWDLVPPADSSPWFSASLHRAASTVSGIIASGLRLSVPTPSKQVHRKGTSLCEPRNLTIPCPDPLLGTYMTSEASGSTEHPFSPPQLPSL